MDIVCIDELQSILAFIDKPNDWKNVNSVCKKWQKAASRLTDDKAALFSIPVTNRRSVLGNDGLIELICSKYLVLPNNQIHGIFLTFTHRQFYGTTETVKRFKFGTLVSEEEIVK